MKDIKKLVKSLKEFDLLMKYVSETIKNEIKGQKGRFFSLLLSTLDGDLLRSLLSGKEWLSVIRTGYGWKQLGKHVTFSVASSFN